MQRKLLMLYVNKAKTRFELHEKAVSDIHDLLSQTWMRWFALDSLVSADFLLNFLTPMTTFD